MKTKRTFLGFILTEGPIALALWHMGFREETTRTVK